MATSVIPQRVRGQRRGRRRRPGARLPGRCRRSDRRRPPSAPAGPGRSRGPRRPPGRSARTLQGLGEGGPDRSQPQHGHRRALAHRGSRSSPDRLLRCLGGRPAGRRRCQRCGRARGVPRPAGEQLALHQAAPRSPSTPRSDRPRARRRSGAGCAPHRPRRPGARPRVTWGRNGWRSNGMASGLDLARTPPAAGRRGPPARRSARPTARGDGPGRGRPPVRRLPSPNGARPHARAVQRRARRGTSGAGRSPMKTRVRCSPSGRTWRSRPARGLSSAWTAARRAHAAGGTGRATNSRGTSEAKCILPYRAAPAAWRPRRPSSRRPGWGRACSPRRRRCPRRCCRSSTGR